MDKHLKEESYYNDLYDLWTIERCLSSIERWQKCINEKFNDEGLKTLTVEERTKGFAVASNLELFAIKGERFRLKYSTVKEWMDHDRKRDEKFKNAQEPKNIRCPNCSGQMNVTLKNLYDLDDLLRVLFFFECKECGKRKGIFDDGEFFKYTPELCPKCNQPMKNSYKREGQIETWSKNCEACGFVEVDAENLEEKRLERTNKEKRDKDLLEKHRAEFCITNKEGEEYLESLRRLEALADILKRSKERQTDPDYQKVSKLKKLTIVELEKVLSETLEKEKYIRISFDKPDIGKQVMVSFTIQDADSSRKEYDSVRRLKKFIKNALDGTNWRLMSEGICYKLGYLTGRLKGCDQEDDLMQMVKSDERTTD